MVAAIRCCIWSDVRARSGLSNRTSRHHCHCEHSAAGNIHARYYQCLLPKGMLQFLLRMGAAPAVVPSFFQDLAFLFLFDNVVCLFVFCWLVFCFATERRLAIQCGCYSRSAFLKTSIGTCSRCRGSIASIFIIFFILIIIIIIVIVIIVTVNDILCSSSTGSLLGCSGFVASRAGD